MIGETARDPTLRILALSEGSIERLGKSSAGSSGT
jgi:hypothetical protein